MGGIGTPEGPEAVGPSGVVPTARPTRAREGAFEETCLSPRTEAVLAPTPCAASMAARTPFAGIEVAVGRKLEIVPEGGLGRTQPARLTGDTRVVETRPIAHPIAKEAGHPAA